MPGITLEQQRHILVEIHAVIKSNIMKAPDYYLHDTEWYPGQATSELRPVTSTTEDDEASIPSG